MRLNPFSGPANMLPMLQRLLPALLLCACTATNPDLLEPDAAQPDAAQPDVTVGDADLDASAPEDMRPADEGLEPDAALDEGPDGPRAPDLDEDGVPDAEDNCPQAPNRDQADSDEDGIGDLCDPCPNGGQDTDEDEDGVRHCDGDCDDRDPQRNPRATERCDGVDNDCDEAIDEDYLGLGEACRVGEGACESAGVLACAPDGVDMLCAPEADPVPQEESCDGRDEDCDGTINEGAAGCCRGGEERECGSPTGACTVGVQRCERRAWGPCDGVGPQEEACDGRDLDCDGQVDEEVRNACGECGPVPDEVCNNGDDDCDGLVDEALRNACGECGPAPIEVCNGRDDDCDGATDEGVASA